MKARVRTILELLDSRSGYITIGEIAEATGAGARTIHRDLESLSRSLGLRGIRLERRRGHGVRLIDPLPENLTAEGFGKPAAEAASAAERPLLILQYLIAAGDWIKLSELAHTFFVSDSSVSSDLSALEGELPAELHIERHKGIGARVTGSELAARMCFLASFPSLFPPYTLIRGRCDDEEAHGTEAISTAAPSPPGANTGYEDRVSIALELRGRQNRIMCSIAAAERELGFRFAPFFTSLIYGYLYLLYRRAAAGSPAPRLPRYAVSVPTRYLEAAALVVGTDEALADAAQEEVELLGRVLSACEVAAPPTGQVTELVGDLASAVNPVIERTLGVLEARERAWLHDDQNLIDYLRMTISAAIRRMDLGIPRWAEFSLHPYPALEESPEAAALTEEFLAQASPLIGEVSPAVARRELGEATLALGARVETVRRRRAAEMSVRILCYEGLGMSSFLRALARQLLPSGARIDYHWDPDFRNSPDARSYDLVVSTFPLGLDGVCQIVINSDAPPEEIREELRGAIQDSLQSAGRATTGAGPEASQPLPSRPETANGDAHAEDGEDGISLPTIISVVNTFFVAARDPARGLIDQIVSAMDDTDCEPEVLRRDLERRESYGSLIFDEVNVRLVHGRTRGVVEPRAGVVQTPEHEPTVLALAAPTDAPQAQTRVLSELVVALTETDGFPELLAEGDRKTIQAGLLSLFSQRFV